MIPAKFDYVKPASVADAVSALQQAGDDAKIIAGGQSLIPVLRLRLAAPSVIVDLGGIAELKGVREDGDRIAVGAMTTYYDILHDDLVAQHECTHASSEIQMGYYISDAVWPGKSRTKSAGSAGRLT